MPLSQAELTIHRGGAAGATGAEQKPSRSGVSSSSRSETVKEESRTAERSSFHQPVGIQDIISTESRGRAAACRRVSTSIVVTN